MHALDAMTAVLLVFAGSASDPSLPVGADTSLGRPNCGVASVLAIASVMGISVPSGVREEIGRQVAGRPMNMLEMKALATQLGLRLAGVRCEFHEILELDRPAIVALRDPEHFALVLDGDEAVVRVVEQFPNIVHVSPRGDFEQRFAGYALLPATPDTKDGARIQVDRRHVMFNCI